MSESQSEHKPNEQPFGLHGVGSGPDWRIWFGVSLTTFWLIVLSLYVSNTVGWANIGNAPIETVGNFLEGAFAPLAFLWLVIGYFLQKKELMQNTDPEGFSRSLLQLSFRHGDIYAYKLLYGTAIRTQHCDNFIFNFDRLVNAAAESDASGMIKDALLGSAHGRFYQRMIGYRDTQPPGFEYGVYNFDPDSIT